jgi:hypothetical protein
MKTIFISLFALLSVFTAFAQFDGNKPLIATYDQYWTFGFHYGIAQFKGDISSKSYFAKLKDESKPSFSFDIGRQISPVFSIKAEFSMSSLYSRKDSILYLGDKSNLSMKGDVNEIGLYGILNLNKLFNKSSSTDSKWNIYLSSGLGYAFFRSRLRDEINNVIVDSVGYTAGGKTSRLKEIVFPVTVGLNLKITDGIWLSLENSSRFINSDRVDAYIDGKTDWFSTTKIGLTFNIQKLGSIKLGGSQKTTRSKASSYNEPTYEPVASTKSQRRSVYKGSSKTPPEIIDYTGFNPMIPPPVIKNTVISNQNQSITGNGNKDENRWVDPNNPGQFEITGVYNKKTIVDTLEVKKIKEGKFKGRTIRISRGFGPSGSSRSSIGVGAPITRSVNRSTRVSKAIPVNFEPGTIYKIQIQASKENIPVETMAKKMNISEKVTMEMTDGWYRYYVGSYTAYSAARQNLESYRSRGLKDAFLCAFPNGVRQVIRN